MTEDERHMARAIELARRPGKTSPNPRVGCVIVRAGAVISEGWHRGAGSDHAEAAALDGVDATGATLYVNLEPCDHTGRRPPCAPVIANSGIERVVVALTDPDSRVSGKGIERLRASGVEVDVGVLSEEARRLNAAYLHHRTTGRPLLTLKLAFSADGRVAAPDGSSRWITGEAARAYVHERRAEVDAVMVGAGTVLADDPSLTSRTASGKGAQPLRLVIDGSGRVPATARIFAGTGVALVATIPGTHEAQMAWKETGAEVEILPEHDGHPDIGELLSRLGRRGFTEVYCEGGTGLATALLRAEIPDRLEFFYAPVLLGEGGPTIGSLGVERIEMAMRYSTVAVERMGDDVLMVMERNA